MAQIHWLKFFQYSNRLNLIRKLKKSCVEGNEDDYKATIAKASPLVTERYQTQKYLREKFSAIKPSFKKIQRNSNLELRDQKNEMKVERMNRKLFASYFYGKFSSLHKVVRSNQSEVQSLKESTQAHKLKYTRKK
jgi:hypothetical protein